MTTRMGRVTCDLSISINGYSAGLNQTEQRPFGDDGGDGWGDKLHAWMSETPQENPAEVDRTTAARAFIIGRNAGGATTRRSTPRCSCSLTTRATRSRWTAAPRSTSSPTESNPH